MSEVLEVKSRDKVGKRNNRRLRASGSTPAVLYGHGTDPVSMTIPTDQLQAVLRHGSHVVDLTGGLKEKALIREIQYDVFGIDILHVDFTRVSADERVQITLAVTLRGMAPGAREGGVVQQVVHEVEVECKAVSIPELLELNINELNLNESLLASDIEIPGDVSLITPADTVMVQCNEPVEELPEEEEGAEAGAEPEVIGEKEEEESAGE